jgi:photosystem II stability/assembly factor-like uncharacterized protein
MRLVLFIAFAGICYAQHWMPQNSGTEASLRGVNAPGGRVVWASGAGGACLLTTDGGASWKKVPVPGGEDLDFRGVVALDARTAWLMSSGEGAKSRVYLTHDGGANWRLVLPDPDSKGFFDAIAFWDQKSGIVVGDPVDGRVAIFLTGDGGEQWTRQQGPRAITGEGLFAASNSSLILAGKGEAWFATGAPGAARAFRSTDGGQSWRAVDTGMRSDAAGAGVFSLARSGARIVAVGGKYDRPGESDRNIAISPDRGATWTTAISRRPRGYRSAVAFLPAQRVWLTVGTSGSEISRDDAQDWEPFDDEPFNALAVSPEGECWTVGPKGQISRFEAGVHVKP